MQNKKSNEFRFNITDRIRTHLAIERYFGGYLNFFGSMRRSQRFARHREAISPDVRDLLQSIAPSKRNRALDRLRSQGGDFYVVLRNYGLVPGNYPRTPQEFSSRVNRSSKRPSDEDVSEVQPPFGLFRIKRRIDSHIGATLCSLGADISYRIHGVNDRLARNFVTSYHTQEIGDSTTADLPQRFITSTTQYALPNNKTSADGAADHQRGVSETAKYVSYLCVRNWMSYDLFVLPVKDIIRRLIQMKQEDVVDKMTQPAFVKWPPRGDDARWQGDNSLHPILQPDPESLGNVQSYICSFDAARVWPLDPAFVVPLLKFRSAIEFAATNFARRLVLHRNDMLIVDNYRCLVGRYELQHATVLEALNEKLFPQKRRRWLRQHVAFTKRHSGHE